MKILKKISAIALSAAILISISACNKKSDNLLDSYHDFNIDDYITVGEYENIIVQYDNPEATDSEIQAEIQKLINKNITYSPITDRKNVQKGDIANIDFTGYIEGKEEAQDNMTDTDCDLEIGSGSFIAGFEDGLIDANVGDTITLNLVFPENYKNTSFRGKKARFDVKINSISEKIIPELTDEFVAAKTSSKTVDELKKQYAESITASNKKNMESSFPSNVWNEVISNSTFAKYPEYLLSQYKQETVDYVTSIASQMYAMTLEQYIEYVGETKESFDKMVEDKAIGIIKSELAIYAVAQKEGISITQKIYDSKVEEYVKNFNVKDVEELEKYYSKKDICIDMAYQEILDIILKTAKSEIKQ